MNQSQLITKNGVLYNEITKIIKNSFTNKEGKIYVVAETQEIFNDITKTLLNTYTCCISGIPEVTIGEKPVNHYIALIYEPHLNKNLSVLVVLKGADGSLSSIKDLEEYKKKSYTINWCAGEV